MKIQPVFWVLMGMVFFAPPVWGQQQVVDLGLQRVADSFEMYLVPRLNFSGYVTQVQFTLIGNPKSNLIRFRTSPWLVWAPDSGNLDGVWTGFGFQPLELSGDDWAEDQTLVIARFAPEPFTEYGLATRYGSIGLSFLPYIELDGIDATGDVLEGGVALSPNQEMGWYVVAEPATDRLQVFFRSPAPQAGVLTLMDLMGKEIKQQPIALGIEALALPVGAFPAGGYIVRLVWRSGEAEVRRWVRR